METYKVIYSWDDNGDDQSWTEYDANGKAYGPYYVDPTAEAFLTIDDHCGVEIHIYHDDAEEQRLRDAIDKCQWDYQRAIEIAYGDDAKRVVEYEVYNKNDEYLWTAYVFK